MSAQQTEEMEIITYAPEDGIVERWTTDDLEAVTDTEDDPAARYYNETGNNVANLPVDEYPQLVGRIEDGERMRWGAVATKVKQNGGKHVR